MTNTTAWLIKCLLASIVIFVTFITIFVLFVVFPNNSVQNAFNNAVGNLNADPMYCRTDITDHSCYKTESVCSRRNAFVCKTQYNVYCAAFPGVATVTIINKAGEKFAADESQVRDYVNSGEYSIDPSQTYSVTYNGQAIEMDAERLTRNVVANTDFEIIENRIFCVDSRKHQSEHIGKDFGWVKTNREELDAFCINRKNSPACQ